MGKVLVPRSEWTSIRRARGFWHTEDKESLFEQYKGVIGDIVIKYLQKGAAGEFDELFQKGCVGLMVAIDRFKRRRKATFLTYATYWIRKYVFSKEQTRDEKAESLDCHGEEGESLYNVIPSVVLNFGSKHEDLLDALAAARKTLLKVNPRWAEVLRLRFEEGLTQEQTGARLGVTKERARQLEQKALRFLRGELEEKQAAA